METWRMVLRAIAALSAALSLTALALTGCTGRHGEPIRMVGEASPAFSLLIDLKSEYESASQVPVDIDARNRAGLLAAFGGGANTPADLVVVPHHLLGQLVEANAIRPIQRFIDDLALFDPRIVDPQKDLLPWWKEISQFRRRSYGYPASLRTMSLVYRRDLREVKEGTWPEIEEIAQFFRRPEQHIAGMFINGKPEDGLFQAWLAYAYAGGARIIDAPTGDGDGPIVVNSPEAIRATEQYVALRRLSSGDPSGYGLADAIEAFEQGHAVFALLPHDVASRLERTSHPRLAGAVGYIPLPSATGRPAVPIDGFTFVIPARAAHPREAFRVMQQILSNDVQRLMARRGGLSARASVYKDPTLKDVPYLASFENMVNAGVPTPTIPEAQAIIDTMTPILARIVAGEVTPKAGLDAVTVQFETLLSRRRDAETKH